MLRRQLLLSSPAIALLPMAAFAQAYPDHAVKLIIGFPAGTGPDVVGRTLGLQLQEKLRQPVVVDNRAGAGGQIGALAVSKAAPDGYTLLLAEVGSISIAPAAYGKLPYDPARELVPVAEVVRSDFVLVVPPQSPVKDVKGFVAAAKAHGDRVNFGTFGAGTPGHFGAEMFGEQGGFRIEPIHYRNTGDAITALVAGDVQGAFVTTALAAPQIKAGKVRALATTAQARSGQLPDVPTFSEAGMPKVDFSAWFALMAPAETPVATLDLLNRAALDALQSAQVRRTLEEAGFTITGTSRADTARMLKAESGRWATAVKASGFKAD